MSHCNIHSINNRPLPGVAHQVSYTPPVSQQICHNLTIVSVDSDRNNKSAQKYNSETLCGSPVPWLAANSGSGGGLSSSYGWPTDWIGVSRLDCCLWGSVDGMLRWVWLFRRWVTAWSGQCHLVSELFVWAGVLHSLLFLPSLFSTSYPGIFLRVADGPTLQISLQNCTDCPTPMWTLTHEAESLRQYVKFATVYTKQFNSHFSGKPRVRRLPP